MTIYLDLVFLINFFFDFILLFGTKYLLKERTRLIRLLLGSLIGSLSIFLLFLKISSFELFMYKLLISILMILVTFGKRNFKKNFLYFYIISIFLGGGIYFLNYSFSYKHNGIIFFSRGLSINFIVMIILSPLIIYYYAKEYHNCKKNLSNCYEVDIFLNKKKYVFKGYLDTGNTLKDPYKKRGVILINKKIFEGTKKYIYVPYKTITDSGVIKCFNVDKIIINNKEFNNLLIGNTNNYFNIEGSDCILPNIIKEDL